MFCLNVMIGLGNEKKVNLKWNDRFRKWKKKEFKVKVYVFGLKKKIIKNEEKSYKNLCDMW